MQWAELGAPPSSRRYMFQTEKTTSSLMEEGEGLVIWRSGVVIALAAPWGEERGDGSGERRGVGFVFLAFKIKGQF